MSRKLLPLPSREVIRRLKKKSFPEWRQRGSHLTMCREKDKKTTTIPVHPGRDISKGTLKGILNDISRSIEEFNRLK